MADDLHLLKKLDCDSRYVLITTTTKDIYVYLLHANYAITDTDKTEIETGYMPLIENIDPSQTKSFTVNENFRSTNKMNDDIEAYIKARPEYNSFNIINTSRSYKYVIQSKVFAAAVKNCKKVYIDMGTVDTSGKGNYGGSIRLDSSDYGEIDTLEINSGTLLLEDNVTLIVKKADINFCTVDVFNKENENSCGFNILVKNRMDIVNMAIYSTIFTTFSNYNKDADNYLETKLIAAYIRIFGAEKVNNAKFERLLIQGFSKCTLNLIEVEDSVRYGGILKLDRMDKVTLLGITRKINEVDPTAPILKIGRVAMSNIHNINITITNTASISSKYSLISFIEDTTGTTRSVNIYDSNVVNENTKKVTIFNMNNIELQKLYFSNTKINNNVVLLERTNAKLIKLYFNKCTVKGTEFEINDITKLSLTDCDFTISGDLNLAAAYITISGGMFRFMNMNMNSFEDKSVSKIDIQKAEFNGGNFNITNDASEAVMPMFDNGCKYNVTKFNIEKFRTTLNNSSICAKEINLTNKEIVKLLSVLINYRDETNETVLNINSSVSGTLMVDQGSNKLNINIRDENRFLTINPLDVAGIVDTPETTISTNVPIKMKMYNFDNRYIHCLFDEYSAAQSSTIDIYSISEDSETKVLNDSEKQMTIKSEKLMEAESAEYIRYTLTPITK